jgi:hypothetical protein
MKTDTFTCWRDASHEVGETRWGWFQCKVCQAAPPYHDRKVKDGVLLDIYVPRLDQATGFRSRLLVATLRPSTAIVGYRREVEASEAADPNRAAIDTVISYEGWIYGQYSELDLGERWKLGLLHASGRLVTEYPTVATQFARSVDLTKVGTYDPRFGDVKPADPIDITDEDALNDWLQEA